MAVKIPTNCDDQNMPTFRCISFLLSFFTYPSRRENAVNKLDSLKDKYFSVFATRDASGRVFDD